MRLLRVSFLILCGLFIFNGSALAYQIDGGIDVGGLDTLIASATIKNSDASEYNWFTGQVQSSSGQLYKYDVTAGDWDQVNGSSTIFALKIDPQWDYYFIKLGTGGAPTILADHWLYRNEAQADYAVVDLTTWVAARSIVPGNVNIGRVSHIGTVSEPATMLLLGLGLIGLAAFGRKTFFRGA